MTEARTAANHKRGRVPIAAWSYDSAMGMSTKARVVIGALLVALAVPAAGLGAHAAVKHHQASVACAAVKTVETETEPRRQELLAGTAPVVAFVGDSYTQGQWLADPLDGYAFVASKELSDRAYIDGSGGSGFTSSGPCGDATIGSRIGAAMATTPTLVVLQGGINDLGAVGEKRAAISAVRDVHQRESQARVVILGSFSPPAVDKKLVRGTNRELRDAASETGAIFIDPSTWTFPVLDDRVHPTAEGHRIIGNLLAENLSAVS